MAEKKAYDENQWLRLIDEWKKSGQSRRAFCENQNVSIAALQYWRRKIQRKERVTETNRFIEVTTNTMPERVSFGLRIVLPNGIIIEPGTVWDERALAGLVRAVRSL